jgi:ElaB/YqjD/DUF883 family membrane-anchored ribosome-binding protein
LGEFEAQEAGIMSERIEEAGETLRKAAAAGEHALEDSYETVREYGTRSVEYVEEIGDGLTNFVRRQPLIAVGAALLAGYMAAQLLRRMPG